MPESSSSSDSFISALSLKLGLPPTFFFGLLEEDDWSFLIKAHAFVEAALTHLLAVALRYEALAPVLARLDTSDSATGKIAFAKATGLLDTSALRFVRRLSELRNTVIHDVRNVSFDLATWHASLDTNAKRAFLADLTFFATVAPAEGRVSPEKAQELARGLLATSPKHLIWFNLSFFSLLVHQRSNAAAAQTNLERLAASAILGLQQKTPSV